MSIQKMHSKEYKTSRVEELKGHKMGYNQLPVVFLFILMNKMSIPHSNTSDIFEICI